MDLKIQFVKSSYQLPHKLTNEHHQGHRFCSWFGECMCLMSFKQYVGIVDGNSKKVWVSVGRRGFWGTWILWKWLTGGKIGDRLMAEAETNLAINVIPGLAESYEVQGRGELQLGILIENMRREGFELSVSPPKVMYKAEGRQKLEPIEEVTIEINDEHVGLVMEALSHRRAEILDMGPVPGNEGRTRMSLTCPSRGLVGYRSVFSSDTRGTGFMHRAFQAYEKHRGPLGNVRKGVLVSCGSGTITSHALLSLEARGTLFVSPGMEAYDGMIVGEHSRDSDLDINPVRSKELSNMRSVCKDETVRLSPPRLMTLEEAIGYVASDELIEVTPKIIRLRKKYLEANKRKMMSKKPKE